MNRVFAELVNRLPAHGVGVRALVVGSDAVVRDTSGRVLGVAPHTAPLVRRLRRLRDEAALQLRADPDAVVVAHFALYAVPLLGLLRDRRRAFVFHFQGPWAQETYAEKVQGVTLFLKARVERAVYQRADACIVLSGAFGRILNESFGVPWGEDLHHSGRRRLRAVRGEGDARRVPGAARMGPPTGRSS